MPFIDLSRQQKSIQSEINRALKKIFSSQKFILGEYSRELEEKIAKKIGAQYALGVANGSDALYLALLALGVGPQDEVITTPFSFFATAGSISRTGARPVFVDVDPKTFNLDPQKIEAKITKKTKVIMPVHLFGLPCAMDPILALAKRHAIPVVEDAAQSFGASYKGRQTGSMGDIGCFSFYPTKNLGGAGDGGMVVTSSSKLADQLKLLRNHGMRDKYHHERVGINSRLDEIQAAVLLAKLKKIDEWNDARSVLARRYEKGLRGLPLTTPSAPEGAKHTYHLYSITTDRRDALHDLLGSWNIGSGIYYPVALHLQPCYKDLGYKPGDMPVSEKLCKTILSLPLFADLPGSAVDRVTSVMREFFST